MILLQEGQKWCEPSRSIQINDLVLVIDYKLPRNQCPLGHVVETFPVIIKTLYDRQYS